MNIKKLIDKGIWKSWECLYSASWFVFGDLPITWDIKHKRNMAYMRYVLHTEKK